MLSAKAFVGRTLGYLPQEVVLYPKITAINLLDHFAVLKGANATLARPKGSKAGILPREMRECFISSTRSLG